MTSLSDKIKIKRLFDQVLSFSGLIMFMPLMIIIGIMIWISMGAPVIFKQLRPGLDAKPFLIYKFRTMLELKDDKGNYLPDEKRLTSLGRLLRKYSLDELPQLWNVLKGDMSLVGPRPLLLKYVPFFSDEEMVRFKVRPGITGLAQINGRNRIFWKDRLSFDVLYVKNWSLGLDFEILLRTALAVLKKQNVLVLENSFIQDLDEERKNKNLNENSHSGNICNKTNEKREID